MTTETVKAQKKEQATGDVERTKDRPVYMPAVDISESESEVKVVADMPGIDDQAVDIDLERDILTIRGECTLKTPEGYRLAYREFETGCFERAFRITNEVDRDGITAEVKDGVLNIRLPRAKEAQPRKISVKAG